MKVVLAPDSFKEAMTAAEAAAAMARGVLAVVPDAEVVQVPMSDGGEGFTDAVAAALGARVRTVETVDALGRPVEGRLAVGGGTAVLEMATAAGLELVPEEERDVLGSDTRGVGRMIRAALDAGADRLLLGIGGSATNDGGAGMLAELGVRFLDGEGQAVGTTPREVEGLASVDASGLDARLAGLRIEAACDVDNPLLGDRGASAVYGPQKGASPEDVEFLDAALRRLAAVCGHLDSVAAEEGAGAAGGLGYAFRAFLGGRLQSGADLVVEAVELARPIEVADFVFTGEGAMDRQTLMGKTLSGIARVARPAGVPVVAFAGRLGEGVEELYDHGFVGLVPIVATITTLEDSLRNGRQALADAAERAVRLILAGRRTGNP